MRSEYQLKETHELSRTKLRILQLIARKPRTLTELSELLCLAKPSVLDHLRILEEKNLIQREKTDRKWKYYELTLEGKRLVRELSLVDIYSNIFVSIILAISWAFLKFFTQKQDIAKQEVKRLLAEPSLVTEPSVSQTTAMMFEKITLILLILSSITLIILIIRKYSKYKKLKNLEV